MPSTSVSQDDDRHNAMVADASTSTSTIIMHDDKTVGNEDAKYKDETNNNIAQIQAECFQLISLLKHFGKEEEDLQCQVEILAREALLCGFQTEKVEKLMRKSSASSTAAASAAASKRKPNPVAVASSPAPNTNQ